MNNEIAILYATSEGQTEKIARRIAERLREKGYGVEMHHGEELPRDFDITAYDGVIAGASIHAGTYQGYMKKLLRNYGDRLQSMPSAFFSVSLTEADAGEQAHEEVRHVIDEFLADIEWQPTVLASFAGGVPFSRYGFIKKLIMRSIMLRREGAVDTSKDYEYTDWVSVDEFVDQFEDHLNVASAAGQGQRPAP